MVGYTNKEFKNLILNTVTAIDDVFKNIPALEQPIRVYRGQKMDTIINQRSIFSSYISTTHAFNETNDFINIDGCCMYILDIQPGVKVIPIKYISQFVREEELLVQRNCRILLESGKKYLSFDDGEGAITDSPVPDRLNLHVKYCKVLPPL
jgi:hypothetical protein